MQRLATILLIAVSIQCAGAEQSSGQLRGGVPLDHHVYAASHQRRELGVLGWWTYLLNALHCPPGPKHHECMQSRANSGGSSNGGSSSGGGNGSGNSNGSGNGGGSGNGQNIEYSNGSDDEWLDDGWKSSNLDSGGNPTKSMGDQIKGNIWPFIAGALVAGTVGIAFMLARKRKSQDDDDSRAEPLDGNGNHVLAGSLKKRMQFWKKRKGGRADDDNAPGFIEVASVRRSGSQSVAGDERSVMSGANYRAPEHPPIVFENEGASDDDSDF